jgi:hypothetical protein
MRLLTAGEAPGRGSGADAIDEARDSIAVRGRLAGAG